MLGSTIRLGEQHYDVAKGLYTRYRSAPLAFFIMASILLALIVSVRRCGSGPDGPKPGGANGGEIIDVEGGHLELTIGEAELRIYVTDPQDARLPTVGLARNAKIVVSPTLTTVANPCRRASL